MCIEHPTLYIQQLMLYTYIYMYQLANLESRFQAPPAGPAATAAVTHCAILQAEHT